jgi:hypothetical protein
MSGVHDPAFQSSGQQFVPHQGDAMKLLAFLLAAAGLSGCVAVPYAPGAYYGQGASYGQGGYYRYGAPYAIQPQSVFIDGGGGHRSRHGNEYRGRRDRDRDGIPDRVDRDRDGDGVPNRADRRPGNPRRN